MMEEKLSNSEIKIQMQNNHNNEIDGYNTNTDHSTNLQDFDELKLIINTTDQIPAIIIVTDTQGKIHYVNKKFSEITGYSSDEVIGKNPSLLKSGDHPLEFYQKLWNTISSGKMWDGEFHNKKKNGEMYWEHATISPIYDKQRNLTYFIAIKQETTNRKEMENNLRIKENALLSSINAIVLTDLKGNITYVNPSFLGMWGYDSEKRILNKPVFSLWRKGGEYVKIMDEIVRDGGWFGEVIAKAYDGRLFPIQMSASMVKDEFNRLLCVMASFVDITKQKRLEKKFKRFKTISDEADYGSIIYDMDGTILYVNKSFAFMHGYYPQDLIGNNLSIFYSEERYTELTSFMNELKTAGNVVGKELYHMNKNGTLFPLLMTSTVIKELSTQNPYIAGTVIDITERKIAEKKIMEHSNALHTMNEELQSTRDQLSVLNQNLEKEVQIRTKKICNLMDQKDGFINQLSHDLKTPLTPMMVLLPILKKSLQDDKDKEILAIVMKNVYFMKDLVEKTIDLAKLNSNSIDISLQEIAIGPFIENILKDNKSLLDEHKITYHNNINDDIFIMGNELRLTEVFNNLITNCLKYIVDDVGQIIFEASLEEDMVTIAIKDNGIGMTPDQIEHIFDEFYKVDESRHDHQSAGLGLSITKKIIEKHGGTIWAESQGIGKGSAFFFTLKIVNKNNHPSEMIETQNIDNSMMS
jgi:PAS domain S-box-containing protein